MTPRKDPDDKLVQAPVGFRADQIRSLERLRNTTGLTRSQMVRAAIDDWLLKRRTEPGR